MAGHADPMQGVADGNDSTGAQSPTAAAALDERDADLIAQAVQDVDDERLLKVTVTKKKGKIGWTRDCDTLCVDEVEKGGAAEAAGIKPTMRIIQVNGAMVSTDEEFSAAMEKVTGDSFELVLDIEELLEANATITVDPAVIQAARAISLEAQVAADAALQQGVDLFMNNEFAKAEKFFEERADADPLAALAHGSIAFLRAVLSFSPRHMRESRRRFAKTCSITTQIAPHQGKLESVKSFFRREKKTTPNYVLRCRTLAAEANLLKTVLLLTEDSVMSHVRAGIGLRRGYLDIENLGKGVDEAVKKEKDSKGGFLSGVMGTAAAAAGKVPPGFPKNGVTLPPGGDKIGHWGPAVYNLYDYNTVGGIQFGLGAINCAISCMPARILAILSAFGFMHDREGGFYNLNVVLEAQGIRSPVAGLFLATFHGTLPSFASVLAADALPKAEALVAQMLGQYPKSAIYLWVAGRVARLKRDVTGAAQLFELSITNGKKVELPEMTHISAYELAWCHCFNLDWAKAIPHFEMLFHESEWSKSFNAYAVAVCLEELGRGEEAKGWYAKSVEKLGRKFGGRTISVEQFIERKVANLDKPGGKSRHPGLEFIMLFNAFPQMAKEKLQEVRAACQATLAKEKAVVTVGAAVDDKKVAELSLAEEQLLVVHLMEANAAKEVGDLAGAGGIYAAIRHRFPAKKWKKLLHHETYVLPYTFYEEGGLCMLKGDADTATPLFEKAESFKDFNFEMPLALRLHLTRDLLRRQKQEKKADEKAAKAAAKQKK